METIITSLEKELRGSGITVEPYDVVKNSETCTGIRLVNPAHPDICPVVYYSSSDTLEQIIDRIMQAANSGYPDIDLGLITDPEYILQHTYLTIQRCSDDGKNVLKRKCQNLELIARISINLGDKEHKGSIKLTDDVLHRAGLTPEAVWEAAEANTYKGLSVHNISDFLSLDAVFTADLPMFICTDPCRNNGGAALGVTAVFKDFCEKQEIDSCYILPSSTEELILLPPSITNDPFEMAMMVFDINQNLPVDPLIQLDPAIYWYDTSTDKISIAASLVKEGQCDG